MRESLAERLLAQVMQWTPQDVARERPLLQAMATFKYDEYQQFAPGMRFVESLALWLDQFTTKAERETAYDFVRHRLVFFSNAEMAHFVSVVYPDHIRPLLIKRTAAALGIPETRITTITKSAQFDTLRRECLFLGLSDGARMDIFRRSNPELRHEQIYQTYELSQERAADAHASLGGDPGSPDCHTRFRMIFLLDDFSASGLSYIRYESGRFRGKLAKFCDQLTTTLRPLICLDDLYVGLVLYVATDKTQTHVRQIFPQLMRELRESIDWDIHVVQHLPKQVVLREKERFFSLTNRYFDPAAEDIHTQMGGTDVKRGFAECGLPVVLCHNTPNNSLFLLWANPAQHKIRGLFPRVSRHRSDS